MNLEEIKTAVRAGKTIHVGNTAYCVNLHTFPNGEEQWLIRCVQNDYCIGLTWADGVTMNGKPEDFFVCEPAPVSAPSVAAPKKPQPQGKPDPRPVASMTNKAVLGGAVHPLEKVWKDAKGVSAPALVLVLRGEELVNVEFGQDAAAVARLAGRLEAGSSLRTVVVPLGLALRAGEMQSLVKRLYAKMEVRDDTCNLLREAAMLLRDLDGKNHPHPSAP